MKFVPVKSLAIGAAILALGIGAAQADGNPVKGKQDFNMICAACHSVKPGQNGAAPTLYDVIGRKAASVPGFNYSSALKKSGITWTPQKIEEWLKGPSKMVPGTAMAISIGQEQERDDIVAYLSQESQQAKAKTH